MRNFILFALLFIGFQANAERPIYESAREYNIDSVRANPDLPAGKSCIIVRVLNPGFGELQKILYGYDGTGFEIFLNPDQTFQFVLDSGEHYFQFFPEMRVGHAEITTDPIQIEAGTTVYISIQFQIVSETQIQMVRKPVIYLYPSEETAVSVVVKPKGEMSFTYPEYADKWECTAFPSGELMIDEKSYNYLFWEAEQTVEMDDLNQTLGKVLLKKDLMEYLESSLDKFGFTSKEKMDFITFWAPQMLPFEATEIRFMFNEECTFFADLDIEPKPDNLHRFYMIWNPTDAHYLDEKMTIEIPTQTRSGFTVLEWGGMEIPRGDRLESAR